MNDTREDRTYYREEPSNQTVRVERTPRKDNSWLPLLLLLPLFFIGGWLANDTANNNRSSQDQAVATADPGARFGVGGGPGDEISPLPEDSTEVMPEATVTPSPSPRVTETPEATQRATTAPSATLERNGEEDSI